MVDALLYDYEHNYQFDFANLEREYQSYLAGVLAKVTATQVGSHGTCPSSSTKAQEKSCATKCGSQSGTTKSSLALEIENARGKIIKALNGEGIESSESGNTALEKRVKVLEDANARLLKTVENLTARLSNLEKGTPASASSSTAVSAPASAKKAPDADDDFDLFGSDEDDDAEAERVKAERLKAYEEKKSKKPALIAKSNIILDVKPWDNETDMAEMERLVRTIKTDGLLWGSSKLVPVAYGIKKLQISCVVEDDKVGSDFLEEEILKFEDYCQSVDIAAFNKI